MKRFYVFKDGTQQGSTATRELAVDLICQYQKLETHPFLSFEDEYRELMEKPIEEIKEDIFFRMDNFQHEPWYGEFELFLAAGVCQPPEEQALQVRKALKVVGYDTHTVSRGGRTYILPGEARQTAREPEPKKHDDRER